MKICDTCKIEKTCGEFYKHRNICKKCFIARQSTRYYGSHKEYYTNYNKQYNSRSDIKQRRKEYYKKWILKNGDRRSNYGKQYSQRPDVKARTKTEAFRKRRADYKRNRVKRDLKFKLSTLIRARLYAFINGTRKPESAIKELGCSLEDFKSYIESKFKPGMTWANWAKEGWHLDHIKPLSSFNLEDEQEFSKACHYTNYQPLWWDENIRKSNKL